MNYVPTKTYNRDFKNIGNYKIIEPYDCDKQDTPSLIFFSGARGLIPNEIYTNFINYVASNKVSCCIYNGDFDKLNNIVDNLSEEYANVTVSGHSSGGNRAIKLLEINDKVKNGILFDPVDDRLFFDNKIEYLFKKEEEKNFKLTNKNNLLFIRAKKAYEWNMYPPSTPFIPFFDIKPESVVIENDEIINNYYDEEYVVENNNPIIYRTKKSQILKSNKFNIDIDKFGHCDLLDKYWSDLAHDSISKGYDDRKSNKLDLYHQFNAFLVKEVCYNNLVDIEESLKEIAEPKEFGYNIKKF
tara:strand:- start:393 stop:1289 length:897 start_codon:yes stop_codon:yes gene_type:complete